MGKRPAPRGDGNRAGGRYAARRTSSAPSSGPRPSPGGVETAFAAAQDARRSLIGTPDGDGDTEAESDAVVDGGDDACVRGASRSDAGMEASRGLS